MERYAKMLGRTQDAAQYHQQADDMLAAFNAKFLNSDSNQYDNGTQTGAYAASVLLAALAIVTLGLMTMVKPREEAHGDRGA